jgi:hypothetical protein
MAVWKVSMKVSRPNQSTLIVTKSRFGGLLYIVALISIIVYLFNTFGILFTKVRFPEDVLDFFHKNPGSVFILVLLLPFIQKIAIVISLIINGEEYVFDGITKTVLKNQKYYVSFSDIAHLEVSTPFFGARIIGNIREHRLQIRLHSLKKIHIHTSDDLSQICKLADDIGNIISVGVVRTGVYYDK